MLLLFCLFLGALEETHARSKATVNFLPPTRGTLASGLFAVLGDSAEEGACGENAFPVDIVFDGLDDSFYFIMSSLLLGSKWKQKKLEEEGISASLTSEPFREKEKGGEKELDVELEKERKDEKEERVHNEEEKEDDDVLCPELLAAAILENHYERVELLLSQYNFDPNRKSENGSAPLHLGKPFVTVDLLM